MSKVKYVLLPMIAVVLGISLAICSAYSSRQRVGEFSYHSHKWVQVADNYYLDQSNMWGTDVGDKMYYCVVTKDTMNSDYTIIREIFYAGITENGKIVDRYKCLSHAWYIYADGHVVREDHDGKEGEYLSASESKFFYDYKTIFMMDDEFTYELMSDLPIGKLANAINSEYGLAEM